MKTVMLSLVCLLGLSISTTTTLAQSQASGIDPEVIIERVLAVEQQQRGEIRDVILDAEYIEGENKDEGFVEKVRFDKRIYIKYLPDTAWFHEEYLAYYKDGEQKSQKDLEKEAKDRTEKKRKRKTRDISFPMLKPFYPENRDEYDISYAGIASDKIGAYTCHHFRVESLVEDDQHINGDYYVDAESFQLVRVDFVPAKLVKKLMFRMKELNMSILYGPSPDDYWFPRQFDIEGRGKAAIFIGVKFAGTEYYSNPIVNSGIDDEIFEVDNGD